MFRNTGLVIAATVILGMRAIGMETVGKVTRDFDVDYVEPCLCVHIDALRFRSGCMSIIALSGVIRKIYTVHFGQVACCQQLITDNMSTRL